MDVTFNGYNCFIKKSHYPNHNVRLVAYDKEDGCPVATITSNVMKMEQGEIVVKNYAENEGIYEALVEAKIISPAHDILKSGFVELQVCYLEPDL